MKEPQANGGTSESVDWLRADMAAALNAKTGMCDEFDPNDMDSGCPDCADLLGYVDALLPVVYAYAASGAKVVAP